MTTSHGEPFYALLHCGFRAIPSVYIGGLTDMIGEPLWAEAQRRRTKGMKKGCAVNFVCDTASTNNYFCKSG